MTGTGTQADPYIPTTLSEFISAVGTAGAYVALTQDINAADDPAYTGELTTPIYINAARVDGDHHEVRGVTVRATNLIQFRYAGADIYGLNFRDWAHKRTSDDNCTIDGKEFITHRFHDCLFSIKIDCGGHSGEIVKQSAFYTCALSVMMIDAVYGRQIDTTVFDTTTILVDGMNLKYSSALYGTPFTRSALILKNAKIESNARFVLDSGGAGGYIAFLDGLDGVINLTGFVSTGSICLAAAPQGQQMTLTTAIQQATFDQMKDQDWLTSVGFLP